MKILNGTEFNEIIDVINGYTKGLSMLDDYDHRSLGMIKGTKSDLKISYDECIKIINKLRFAEDSNLFAVERDRGLEAIIGDIYQTFGGVDVYPTVEEKAANFLYFVVKNHVFVDGNKRIAATLFIYFLAYYGVLFDDLGAKIDNNTLAAITLLIAESHPSEKDIIIRLVLNFLA